MKPEVVYMPEYKPPAPRPPRWWHRIGKPTGTVVQHDGAYWVIIENWSWGDYGGRSWQRVGKQAMRELRARANIDE